MALNIDWDNLLSYQTVKIVKIRDKRLGLLHILFITGIILYIAIGTIVLQKRYLATEAPIGSIRTSLLAPTYRDPTPPYCTSSGNTTYNGFPTMACEYWDEVLTMYPPAADDSLFVTTRVSSESQNTTNGCSLSLPNCTYTSYDQQVFFIADVTNFTILLDHTLSAPALGIQYNARQLPGILLDHKGNPWTPPAPSVVGVEGDYDILTLGTCLEAAGITSLDAAGTVIGENNSTRSLRDDGLVLLVFITYSNMYTYSTSKFRYTYQFNVISDTKYKTIEPIYTTDVSHRLVFNRHGVKMIFIQTGALGMFDFQTMLLTFVSGIGLVTVSTLIVDVLAVRLLPQKEKYQKLKYQEAGVGVPLLQEHHNEYAGIDPRVANPKFGEDA